MPNLAHFFRTAAGLFAAAAALLFFPPASLAEVKNPDAFTYAINGDVDSLDPHWQYDGISHAAQYQLYEGLVFFKGGSVDEFEPRLATVVPSRENGLISPDGLRVAFPIRKKVKFHDGSELTPEDVRYSLLRFLLTDRDGGPSALLLEPLLGLTSTTGPDGKPLPDVFKRADKAVRLERKKDIVLYLNKPAPHLLAILAAFAPVVSKASVVARGGWDGGQSTWQLHRNVSKQQAALYDRANGTGPFRLERWDKENKLLVLARHDGYWRKAAALKFVAFKTVGESGTRKLMLEAGDADAAMIERPHLPQVAGIPGVTVLDDLPLLEVHNAFIFNFNVNMEGNPDVGSGRLDGSGIPNNFFADINVRKGFALAFDYEAYIRDGYRGKAERAHGPIPKGVFGHNPRQIFHNYDPARAADHFKKAWGGEVWDKGFELTVSYQEGRVDRQLACQILKKGVESLNPKFRVNVRAVQWSTWLSSFVARKLPLINGRWALDYADPHNAVFPFLHSSGYYAKASSYSNERLDRLIEAASQEVERDKRRKLYYDLQETAYAEAPQIYTIDTFNAQVLRAWVKGWTYHPIVMYGYLYPVSKQEDKKKK